MSKFKREAINCLASIGFFDNYPTSANGLFTPDGKPPTKGLVAVYAYKWLRDKRVGLLEECDRSRDYYDDLRESNVWKLKR